MFVLALGALLQQEPATPGRIAGRWRIEVSGITPSPLNGELVFVDSARALRGRVLLSNHAGPPVELINVSWSGGTLHFVVPSDGGASFTGQLSTTPTRLRGEVTVEGGRIGRWSADPLDPSIEFYPVLPQFRMRQMVGGVAGDRAVLPGTLAVAANAMAARANLEGAYDSLARAGGVTPLDGAALQENGPQRVLGLEQRGAMLTAVQHTMEQLRAALGSDSARAQFDQLFRPSGAWRLDLHAAALGIARRRMRQLQWTDVVPALQAAGWMPDSGAVSEVNVPRALERVLLLRAADSVAAARLLLAAAATTPASARALAVLLDAYPEATEWHQQALGFLLRSRWVPQGNVMRSPVEVVRATWALVMPGDAMRALATPAIVSEQFGLPQAVPRYGASTASAARLAVPLNWSAQEWVTRHGAAASLGLLQLLDLPGTHDLLLSRHAETFRVVSVKQHAAESSSGFLEQHEAIAVEPSYVPLLALGAVLHEWGHLLAEGWRFDQAVMAAPDSGEVVLPGVNPWLVEGIAEAWTDMVLAPILPRYPLVGFSEAEKRVRLSGSEQDPHVTGYLMSRALIAAATSTGASAGTGLQHLIEAGEPAHVIADPLFRSAIDPDGDIAPLIIPAPSRRFLVPEEVFTVDTNFPDPVRTIIRTGE